MVKVRVYLRRDDTNKARRVRGGDVGWPGDGGAGAGPEASPAGGQRSAAMDTWWLPNRSRALGTQVTFIRDLLYVPVLFFTHCIFFTAENT
jgi:hypothetical protein